MCLCESLYDVCSSCLVLLFWFFYGVCCVDIVIFIWSFLLRASTKMTHNWMLLLLFVENMLHMIASHIEPTKCSFEKWNDTEFTAHWIPNSTESKRDIKYIAERKAKKRHTRRENTKKYRNILSASRQYFVLFVDKHAVDLC